MSPGRETQNKGQTAQPQTSQNTSQKQNKNKTGRKKKQAKQQLVEAKVEQYFEGYTKLQALQEICESLGFKPAGSTSACKKQLTGIHINIIDYVDGHYELCKNKQELLRRCRDKGFYPKEKAKTMQFGPLLRVLF